MVSLWTVDIVLASITSVVLVALLAVYLRTYRRMRTTFGLGLISFAGILLAQGLFAAYTSFTLEASGYQQDVALPILVINTLGLVALAVLLRLSWD